MNITGFIERYRTKISQILGLAYILAFVFSEKRLEITAPAVTGVMVFLGCVLVGLATVGRLWCAQYIAGYKTDVLITEGPYSVCRNPLYFFSFLGGCGAGLCTESLILAAIVPLVFALLYPITIQREEKKLMEVFGEPYRAYMASVPRFIPRWSLFHEPEQYLVNTKTFRREVSDALYFVWIVGLLEMIEIVIEVGLIQTKFTLY